MTILQQLAAAQNSAEIPVNENFETLEAFALYGKNHATTAGLTWGYYGGRWGGTPIAAGTVTLGASATTYIVVERATGTLTAATSTTNWSNTTDYARVYKITTGPAAVTAVEDHRQGPGGVGGGAGGGSSSVAPWKFSVRAATAVAGTLATSFENGDTIDGVVLATSDRILLKDQATAADNGIYVVAASGAPSRATDANSGDELVGAVVMVQEGTANGDKLFKCTTNAPITLGSTALAFAEIGSAAITWGAIGGTLSAQTDLQNALNAKAQDRRTVSAITPAAGVADIDVALGDYFTLAPTANVTSITFSNLPGSGKGASVFVRFTQDSTPRTVAWPASFRWEGTAPSVSTASGAIDLLALTTLDNGTVWDATLSKGRA